MNKWKLLLSKSFIEEQVNDWLKNPNILYYKIKRKTFHDYNLRPKDMIPQYAYDRLPLIFKEKKIEILRTGKGECILTKTGKGRKFSSIFPELPKITNIYKGVPFNPVNSDSLLLKQKLINEESGLFLAIRSGILNAFLVEMVDSHQLFLHSGRIKKNLSGRIYLGGEEIVIKSDNLECDGVMESNEYLIPIEVKRGFSSTFSIHQIAFPMLFLRSFFPSKKILGLFIQFTDKDYWVFRFYLIGITLKNDLYDLLNYSYLGTKEFRLDF